MNSQQIQMMLNRVKMINPQGYQMINNLMNSGGNPMVLLKQILGNKTPEQLNSFFSQAKSMGYSDDFLVQIQNGINSK